jgi:hypothetical protein
LALAEDLSRLYQVDKSAALHKASLFKQHINVVCTRFSLFSSVSFRACIMQVAFNCIPDPNCIALLV